MNAQDIVSLTNDLLTNHDVSIGIMLTIIYESKSKKS